MPTTVKQHDTWPPLRGKAEDEDGLVDLTVADSLKFLAKDGVALIEGAAEPIDPPDADGFNWSYTWQAGDTDVVGEYDVELEVTWDAGTTPPQVETIPNEGNETLTIEADQG